MAELESQHRFFYNTSRPVPAWEVAEALLALESITRRTGPVLEKLFPGVSIDRVDLYIARLEAGSLDESVIIKLLFGTQENFELFLGDTRKTLGLDKMSHQAVLRTILVSLVLYGAYLAVSHWASAPEARIQVQANNNVVIAAGAELLKMSPEDLRKLIESTIRDRRDREKLANDAIRIIRPAKGGGDGSSIQVDGDDHAMIAPETVSSIPMLLMPEEPDQRLEDFNDVQIEIRATDLDSLKRGWGARIPAAGDRRVPLQLDGGIDPAKLTSGSTVVGSVTVVFRNENGKDVPRQAYLRSLKSAPSPSSSNH